METHLNTSKDGFTENYMWKVTSFSTVPSMRITELPLPTPNILNTSSFLRPILLYTPVTVCNSSRSQKGKGHDCIIC